MQHRIIISGGGTGGHIYPALSIAGALRKIEPDIEILFVGAEGKMEMEKVPAAGYRIIGLPVAGLQRRLTAANLSVPFKVLKSICRAGRIIKEFRPDVVVGVGGYASAPMLWRAEAKGIPTLIQEQNSYAGLTNKILGKRARRICVAYSGHPGQHAPLHGRGETGRTGNVLPGSVPAHCPDSGRQRRLRHVQLRNEHRVPEERRQISVPDNMAERQRICFIRHGTVRLFARNC